MKTAIVFTICLGLFATQIAADPVAADGAQSEQDLNVSPRPDIELTEAVYIGESIECTVVEVATQYESSSFGSEFQCVANPSDAAGLEPGFYQLNGLPPEFGQIFRSQLKSGEVKLEASNVYRIQHKLIFTTDTVWSLNQISKQ